MPQITIRKEPHEEVAETQRRFFNKSQHEAKVSTFKQSCATGSCEMPSTVVPSTAQSAPAQQRVSLHPLLIPISQAIHHWSLFSLRHQRLSILRSPPLMDLDLRVVFDSVQCGEGMRVKPEAAQYNILKGTALISAFMKPVLVGRNDRNQAVHGDIVFVEVFHESERKVFADDIIDQDGVSHPIPFPRSPSLAYIDWAYFPNTCSEFHLRLEAKAIWLAETKKAPAKERQPTGCVVGDLEQNGRA
ncbi:hypothetical protein HYDPIDRAFT_32459 [Hydnomerulius pinastri MD-312]|uniref:CSD1 domain-containing protein n=1 Tax=Hydnomerulius pinastri MD-312 TaxID=994086 RepID=A0A0C9VR33_9AGAM|nr:hypothetical protein HYDPIDRAFT_32459 [Hydnomerulius pinastri MD-312]